MWAEFRAFLVKTNALALALAFIIGVALAAVVTSLVADIIMPPVGLLLGKVDFQNLYINLSGGSYPSLKAAKEAGAATINYGVFINQVITFVIVALVVFLIARRMIPNVPTKVCPYCAADDLPMAAKRCPHCTSQLGAVA
ncbi:MAG TPA: large conductance mechanosensitive channel protein MscL [Candidatus Limnocylindria bacterium]|jgi:large conductance mechanosensitive channel|nr:large conductance mechanosensitive channel protein MscL [Candidatus Limnocylindria bacterium]